MAMHQEHATLHAGQTAPLFSLPDADMEPVKLVQYRGKKNVVLYFYPRDGTPGCTMQATDFSDHENDFAHHDCVVIGVSPDDCLRHAEFRDAVGVSITLLSDADNAVCARYGVLRQKPGNAGQGSGTGEGSRHNITRATFIIDKHGTVRHAMYDVNPRGHAAEVLALVKKLPR